MEYLAARLMDHSCLRSARLYYTTCTNKEGRSFAPIAATEVARSRRTKEQCPDRWLLVALHRRLRDQCGIPTEAGGRTRPGQASKHKRSRAVGHDHTRDSSVSQRCRE